MGNRLSQSESTQQLSHGYSWHGYPNPGFSERRSRRSSQSSVNSSPGNSVTDAAPLPPAQMPPPPPLPPRCCPRRWSTAIVDEVDDTDWKPRIQPIIRDGQQVTKDFYWVLPQRRRHRQYHNLPPRRPRHSDSELPSPQLLARVRRSVLGVTDDECFVALSLHSWDAVKAERYLKVEQLFRFGLADRQRCQQQLQLCNWDLQTAATALLHNCD